MARRHWAQETTLPIGQHLSKTYRYWQIRSVYIALPTPNQCLPPVSSSLCCRLLPAQEHSLWGGHYTSGHPYQQSMALNPFWVRSLLVTLSHLSDNGMPQTQALVATPWQTWQCSLSFFSPSWWSQPWQMNLSDPKQNPFQHLCSAACRICSIAESDAITVVNTAFGKGKMTHTREVLGVSEFMI